MKSDLASLAPVRAAGSRQLLRDSRAVLLQTSGQSFAAELRRLLELLSVPVRHCASGAEALARLGGEDFRCLVSAAEPPDMSTLQLIAAFRGRAPQLPVIVVAEAAELDSAVAAMRAGAHAIIDSRQLRSGLLRHVPGLPGHA